MELEKAIETTARWLIESEHVVIFTGAGISTASGLSDFRGPDGVWTRRDKGLPPLPSKIPRDQMKPNEGHYAILELEKMGKVNFLISQNVDGFHLDSGFPQEKLAELHGNTNYMVCMGCNWKYRHAEIGWNRRKHGSGYRTSKQRPNQPTCPKCGGRIISSIVNFGDPLPDHDLELSIIHSKQADLFIVLGSSLVVTPAANMVGYAKRAGAKLVINNKGKTPYDRKADLLLPVNINDFFPPVVKRVKKLLDPAKGAGD